MSRSSNGLTGNSNEENDENGRLSSLSGYVGCFIFLLLLGVLVNVGEFLWNDVISPGFIQCTYEVDQVVTIEISETENRGYLTHLTKTPWKCDEEVRIELQEAIHIPNDIQSGTIKVKIATVKGPYAYIGNVVSIKLK